MQHGGRTEAEASTKSSTSETMTKLHSASCHSLSDLPGSRPRAAEQVEQAEPSAPPAAVLTVALAAAVLAAVLAAALAAAALAVKAVAVLEVAPARVQPKLALAASKSAGTLRQSGYNSLWASDAAVAPLAAEGCVVVLCSAIKLQGLHHARSGVHGALGPGRRMKAAFACVYQGWNLTSMPSHAEAFIGGLASLFNRYTKLLRSRTGLFCVQAATLVVLASAAA